MVFPQYDAFDIGFITTDEFTNSDILEATYPAVKSRLCSDYKTSPAMPIVTGFLGKVRFPKQHSMMISFSLHRPLLHQIGVLDKSSDVMYIYIYNYNITKTINYNYIYCRRYIHAKWILTYIVALNIETYFTHMFDVLFPHSCNTSVGLHCLSASSNNQF